MPRDFVTFLTAFRNANQSWLNRGGLLSVLEKGRLLDLLGVGYDVDAKGQVLFRPDASPRFAAFSHFEVEGDSGRTLQRLKSAEFDPTTSVILRREPAHFLSRVSAGPNHFRLLHYQTPAADQLTLRVRNDTPRLILFNDRYSPSWEAYWNGKPLQIIPANSIFMAVAVPEGEGELTFMFRPKLFIKLSRVSAITALLLLLLGGIALLRPSFWRMWQPKKQFLE
jgi:hypothetical protein